MRSRPRSSRAADRLPAVSPPATRGGRLALFLTLGAASVYGPATMDINLPALPAIAADLSATVPATQLTITSYLIGLGGGQIVVGALSDALGRRRPFVLGLGLYVLASLACSLAPSVSALVALRVVQGVGSATGVVTVRAVVRDLYGSERSAVYFSRLVLIIGLAPVLAPSVGAQVLSVTSWRGIFVVLAAFGAVTLALTSLVIPETLPRLARRPARLAAMGGAFVELLRQRAFVGYVVATGLASAVMISMITGSTFALQQRYGFSPRQFGLLFGIGAVLMIAVAQLNAWLLARHVPPRTSTLACLAVNAATEVALAVTGSIGAGAAPLCGALLLSLATWGLVVSNTTALALADQGRIAGSASALAGLAQFGLAGVVAPLSGLAGASTTAIGIVTAICSLGAGVSLLALTPRPRPRLVVERVQGSSAPG